MALAIVAASGKEQSGSWFFFLSLYYSDFMVSFFLFNFKVYFREIDVHIKLIF